MDVGTWKPVLHKIPSESRAMEVFFIKLHMSRGHADKEKCSKSGSSLR